LSVQRSCHSWKQQQKASFESSVVQPSNSIWCSPGCETFPLEALKSIFGVGNNQNSLRARSGEHAGLVMKGMAISERNSCTSDVWLTALSWRRNNCTCYL
jgi:hypothetical protein